MPNPIFLQSESFFLLSERLALHHPKILKSIKPFLKNNIDIRRISSPYEIKGAKN